MTRSIRQALRHEDDGVALVVSIALIGIVTILMMSMLAYAIGETRSTGRDRQRSAAVTTAEGHVDATLAMIQNSAPATLPCGPLAPVPVTQSEPDTMTAATTVTYFNAAGAEVPCSSIATSPVVQARVASVVASDPVAGQSPAQRTMETMVTLTPAYANGFDKAIFGNAGVQLANHGEVFGEDGKPNADIYTNGDFTCDNNQRYHGSVFAQGSITLAGTCTVDVDAHARTGFRADNTGVTVTGRVLVSNGTATLVSNATVGQQVRTSGTISWNGCTAAKCYPGSSVPPPPPYDFPVLNWNATVQAEWAANGYTNVVTKNECANASSTENPGRWIATNAPALTTKTIVVTNCLVTVANNVSTIALKNDLAVFARGGFNLSNSFTIKSTDSTRRRLHLVQPYDSVSTHPCTSDGIVLDNRVTVESTVDDLLYTPCNVRKANNSDHYGQIFAGGRAIIDNRLTMFFRQLPVWGVEAGVRPATAYTLDVLYKRETR